MTNARRGEHVLELGDVGAVTLRLSMNALAEIEEGLGCQTIQDLTTRLMNIGVRDIIVIMKALVKAGGSHEPEEVGEWQPTFHVYTDAITQCLIKAGFMGARVVGAEEKNEESQ